MFVTNCLRAGNGVIVFIPPAYGKEYFKTVSEKDVSVSVADYGLEVLIGDIVIPVPEFMIDFLAENRTVTIYLADPSRYMWEPEFSVELPKDGIVEARGAYKHMRKTAESTRPGTGNSPVSMVFDPYYRCSWGLFVVNVTFQVLQRDWSRCQWTLGTIRPSLPPGRKPRYNNKSLPQAKNHD